MAQDLSQPLKLWWFQTLLLPGPQRPHCPSTLAQGGAATGGDASGGPSEAAAVMGQGGWTEGSGVARGQVAGNKQTQRGPQGGAA